MATASPKRAMTVALKRAAKATPEREVVAGEAAVSPPANEMCRLSSEARAAAAKARTNVA